MRRTLCTLVITTTTMATMALVALGVLGCGGAKLHVATSLGAKAAAEATDTCASSPEPIVSEPSPVVPTVEPPWGDRITRVEVKTTNISRELVLSTIRVRDGSILESEAIARDVKALYELEAIETVRVDAERKLDGVILRYEIQERRVVGNVSYRGVNPLIAGHWVPLAKGELYDPVRVTRMRIDLERNLATEGHLNAKVEERQKPVGTQQVDVCFIVNAGPKLVIDRIAFVGNEQIKHAELDVLIKTRDDRVNQVGKPYRDDLLDYDLLFVSALYYDRGFLNVTVGPPRTTLDAAAGHITVEIPIKEGPMYRIRSMKFAGASAPEKTGLAGEYRKRLPIKAGEVFSRQKLLDAFEKIRELHRARGEDVELDPETELDPPRAEVDLVIKVTTTKAARAKPAATTTTTTKKSPGRAK